MKKLLDSDWLRAVQFKCNASANHVISCKLMTKILYGNFEKSLLECLKLVIMLSTFCTCCSNFEWDPSYFNAMVRKISSLSYTLM